MDKNLIGVVPVQDALTFTPHPEHSQWEHKLATHKKINLEWISVMSRMELEEYSAANKIKLWQPKDPRHKTYYLLKYGTTKGYKGGWGPELIVWRPEDELGYVWSTHSRACEIRDWIRDNIFV